LVLYRAAWAPFWAWSDVPAPKFRVHEDALPSGGPAGDHFAAVLNRLARRIWLQRMLTVFARAAWLPLLIGCLWLAFELAGGPDLDWRFLVAFGVTLLLPAAVFAWLVKPSRRRVARMLDQSFLLQERMLTAHENVGKEVVGEGELPSVVYLQMADAANVITELRNHPVFRVRPPVREIVLALVCALVLAALFFMRGVGGGIPALASNAVPPFVPAAERLAQQPEPVQPAEATLSDAPSVAEVEAMAMRSNESQQDLQKLGDALSDQAVTRAASEAIQRGDYDEAADLIRQAGETASDLSQATRDGLADDLEQAASEMSPGENELSQATQNAADGLREGGEAANQGMQELGDQVDETASNVMSQQELSSQMSRAEAAEASQSSSQSGESGDQGESSNGQSSSGQPGDPQNGGQSSEGSESGSDAQPGESSQGGEQGQSGSGEQESGAAAPADDDTGGASGAQGEGQPQDGSQPGDGTQSGESAEGDASSGQTEQEGEGGNPGAGAGSGEATDQTESGTSGAGGESGESPELDPSDPNVTENTNGLGEGEEADPRDAVTLPRSADAPGYQTSSSADTASQGSGGGSAVNDGAGVEQGEVGVAGPDSNHVPPEYRGIVEAYFGDPEGS